MKNTEQCPVHVWQNPFELDLALMLYREIRPARVLEIGTADGGTLWHWARNSIPGTKLVIVDWFLTQYYPDNRELFQTWAKETQTEIFAIKGNSHDAAVRAAGAANGPYNWLHLDAGHHYPDVKLDFDTYRPMMAEGGVIVFHDITPSPKADIEVHRLWAELKAKHRTVEIIADQKADTCGIGILFL